MSEIQITKEPVEELSFGIVGGKIEIKIIFADGERILPDEVVHHLGVEKITEQALVFAQFNFDDFMTAFYKTIETQKLNQLQQQFVNNHFGGGIPGF